jgi:hypothetical protein
MKAFDHFVTLHDRSRFDRFVTVETFGSIVHNLVRLPSYPRSVCHALRDQFVTRQRR